MRVLIHRLTQGSEMCTCHIIGLNIHAKVNSGHAKKKWIQNVVTGWASIKATSLVIELLNNPNVCYSIQMMISSVPLKQ